MRVLHVDSGSEMRGGQWQVLRLVEGTAGTAWQPVLMARAGGPLYQEALRRGLPVEPLKLPALWKNSKSAALVHAHDARSHTLAALLCDAPLIVSRRVGFPLRPGSLTRWKYGRPAHYIAVSEYVKGTLAARGVPVEKISVVYDGVPVPEEPASGELIVAPATDDPRKGSALVERAAELAGVSVVFSRHLEEDLRRASVFVYITRQEGLGSAALLAMAAGVAVVASRVGGLPEVVRHGETGLMVANDPQSIAEAITLLVTNARLRAALSARARELASERFSAGVMVKNTLEVYRKVLLC